MYTLKYWYPIMKKILIILVLIGAFDCNQVYSQNSIRLGFPRIIDKRFESAKNTFNIENLQNSIIELLQKNQNIIYTKEDNRDLDLWAEVEYFGLLKTSGGTWVGKASVNFILKEPFQNEQVYEKRFTIEKIYGKARNVQKVKDKMENAFYKTETEKLLKDLIYFINTYIPPKKYITQEQAVIVKEKVLHEIPPSSAVISAIDNPPITNNNNPDAIAVVIGNRNYSNPDVDQVEFAIRDAETIKKYIINTFGFKPGNVLLIINATYGVFREIFGTKEDYRGKLYNMIKKNKSDVFIYYSGHGAPDINSKEAFIVPVDCGFSPTSLRANGYPLSTFYTNLSKLEVKSITVVIDACFSGVTEASPVGIKIKNPINLLPNSAIFSSSKNNEVSNWYTDEQHGLFTYFFLKAIFNLASSSNEIITAGDIYELVSDETEGVPYWARRLYNGREQTPQLYGDDKTVILQIMR